MIRIISILFTAIITSLYFFPFSFTFWDPFVNTKLILAVLGLVLFILHSMNKRELNFSQNLITASLIALFISAISLFSAEYNHTDDYSYTDYIFSFFTWIFGAYFVASAIRKTHGEFTFKTVTYYLTSVSIFQCVIALIIDNVPNVKTAVNSVVSQGADYLDAVNRLYGIGASLDTAGIKFAIVLILIAYVLLYDNTIKENAYMLYWLILGFVIIAVVGNMISRSTTPGLVLALIALILFGSLFRRSVKVSNIKVFLIFFFIVGLFTFFLVYLFQTNPYYTDLIRFAFEGFFNWAETGEWRTDSTDRLNALMWVWPSDFKTWIIGTGIFGHFAFATDIGYCRFILYFGLIGFVCFSFFFIYNTIIFMRKHRLYRLLFLTLLILNFIIWLKVASDIFAIYALFYWLDTKTEKIEEEITEISPGVETDRL